MNGVTGAGGAGTMGAGIAQVAAVAGHPVVLCDAVERAAQRDAIAKRSWRALELTKLALRSQRRSTTTFDIPARALLFGSDNKHARMTRFLERRGA
jgi:3-hydroxyacyl-CoA dehydrogenase